MPTAEDKQMEMLLEGTVAEHQELEIGKKIHDVCIPYVYKEFPSKP